MNPEKVGWWGYLDEVSQPWVERERGGKIERVGVVAEQLPVDIDKQPESRIGGVLLKLGLKS